MHTIRGERGIRARLVRAHDKISWLSRI